MGHEKKILQAGLLEFGATTASLLLTRPTVQSAVRGIVRKIVTGSREKPFRVVPAVEQTADEIIGLFEQRGLKPRCLGIDGIAGGGKSTLGRSLAKRFGLKWRTLYARELMKPVDLQEGAIYENIRLFRTQDIDRFDAMIYIDVPVEKARTRVLERDRNGTLADVMDFEMLKRLGDLAFEIAEGEEIEIPNSSVKMKFRPTGGFRVEQNLSRMLEEQGRSGEGLCKEEMLFLLCYGKVNKGIRPYLKLGVYNQEVLAGLLVGLLVAFDQLS